MEYVLERASKRGQTGQTPYPLKGGVGKNANRTTLGQGV
jgi:hypothetical protein